jgi:hypothetical protein
LQVQILLGSPKRLYACGSNATPIRLSLRQATWQGRFSWSLGTTRIKRSGIKRSYNFKRRPGLGKVANGAVDRAAAERNRPGLQNTAPRRNPMLVHRVDVRSKGENSINGASGAIVERDQTAK